MAENLIFLKVYMNKPVGSLVHIGRVNFFYFAGIRMKLQCIGKKSCSLRNVFVPSTIILLSQPIADDAINEFATVDF